jgi:hypothetical protein
MQLPSIPLFVGLALLLIGTYFLFRKKSSKTQIKIEIPLIGKIKTSSIAISLIFLAIATILLSSKIFTENSTINDLNSQPNVTKSGEINQATSGDLSPAISGISGGIININNSQRK